MSDDSRQSTPPDPVEVPERPVCRECSRPMNSVGSHWGEVSWYCPEHSTIDSLMLVVLGFVLLFGATFVIAMGLPGR